MAPDAPPSDVRARVLAREVRRRARPSKLRREMAEIKTHVPTWKKLILFSKISGVLLAAVGLEFLTRGSFLLAIVLFLAAIFLVVAPIRVTVNEPYREMEILGGPRPR